MSNIEGNEPITRDTLLKIVNTYPLIDNHAHNLLDSSTSLSCPLEICFSEARGEALQNAIETSALKRGVQQLAKLYNCEATLDAIKHVTDIKSYDELCNLCFEHIGIQCLLLDDGLDSLDGLRNVESHVGLVKCAKRIVRIERIAEQFIDDLVKSYKTSGNELIVELKSFRDSLVEKFKSLANSDLVISFKSIAAYRSGLNVDCSINEEIVVNSLANFISKLMTSEKQETRLVDKILIDYILNLAINVAVKYDIPIQFHTGFGDNDLDLLTSNPLHLRELIEAFPTAKFVLLHSAYPYTRQAGYLASVYSNVYVDFGLVFPLISATGQQTILKELFEICPSNKILFSTDGHYLPESFYVAAIQVRETLGKVLLESIENNDFTTEEAVRMAKQIMFENSNNLYKLNLIPEIISNREYDNKSTGISKHALKKLQYNGVKYVRLGWLDFTNILRFRAIPIDRFIEYIASNGVTVAKCIFSFPLYGDVLPQESSFNASGEILLKPDLNTIVQLPYNPTHAFVHTLSENKWTPSDAEYNSVTSEPLHFSMCLRFRLKNIVEFAKKEFGINFLVGIESEFLLLKGHDDHKPYHPDAIDNSYYCDSAAFHNPSTVSTIEQIIDALQNQNIEVEQFHPESCSGQFEIVTGPDNPLAAADKVVVTRQTIYDVAVKNNLKATFVPKPFNNKAGTASHVHISIHELNQSKKINDDHHSKLTCKERSFIAGVLKHLKAIVALTMPTINSYERAVDHCWCGKWICWGVENRESPIRVCYRPKRGIDGRELDVNLEFKCVDATANPYLALITLLCAGIDGIKKGLELDMLNCQDDPASLSPEARAKLGITERVPDSLEDSVAELKKDEDLIKSVGEDIIKNFIVVKENELDYFKSWPKDKIYGTLIERF